MKAIVFALVAITVIAVGHADAQYRTEFRTGTPVADRSAAFTEPEREIHDLVNRERLARKLNMLVWDEKLAEIARSYSRRMARENFFGHYDSRGLSIEDRAYAANLRTWRKIGENLFYVGNADRYSSMAVRMWMASDSHRENILYRGWTSAGIGISRAENGRIYVTQVFMAD